MREEAPVFETRDVGRVFAGPPPVRVLSEISLRVDPGEYVAIVGPSGSGKSTLMNVLGLLDVPTSGTYELGGVPTQRLSDDERSALRGREIGFVFQDFHGMNHLTAVENVAMAGLYAGIPRQQRVVAARRALVRVGLEHRLGAEPATMSGGERQRVAIARAITGRPAILLCDEPTGSLDSRNASMVLDIFDQLNADGLTLLVVTHDPATAGRAGRRVVIVDGRIRSDTRSEHVTP